MSSDTEAPELYRKYRPTTLEAVVGQPEVCRDIGNFVKSKRFPHFTLFSGPSGCGKTTLARIVQDLIGCVGADFAEINGSSSRGVDTIREIQKLMSLSPIAGRCRIWYVDECHALTKDAQNATLKMLEDTPKHVYFIFATTDPGKLLKTIVTRAHEFKIKLVDPMAMAEMLANIYAKETDLELNSDVNEAIVNAAEGSARKALVLLNAVVGLSPAQQEAAIASPAFKADSFEIARALCNANTTWGTLSKILQGATLKDQEESLRRMVLSYAKAILIKKQDNRASAVIWAFRNNFFDSGEAGFVNACYEVICPPK